VDTKTVLILAAVGVGGFVAWKKLKPGFSAPPAPPIYAQPNPTAPPTSSPSTLDRVLGGAADLGGLVKQGKTVWDDVKSWF
jgi:hypothetical protein